MENLSSIIESLIHDNQYNKAAELVARELNIKLTILGAEYKGMFWDEPRQKRYVFKCKLSRDRKSYTFEFGQSIVKGNTEPTLYDVLTCLQKYEVGTLEDFCGEFGYDIFETSTKRTYKAVLKEYNAMCRLFTESELEILREVY